MGGPQCGEPGREDLLATQLVQEVGPPAWSSLSSLVGEGKKGDWSELERLIRECEVLVEHFRPGAMDRLGLG
jgi:hypothetical protein